MRQRALGISVVLIGVVQLFFSKPLPAHDPGLSTMAVRILDNEIDVRVTLTRAELAGAFGGSAPAGAVEIWADGARLVAAHEVVEDVDEVEVDLVARFPRPQLGKVRIVVPFLQHLAHGHRQYVTVRDAIGATTATNLLSADDNEMEVVLPAEQGT